MTRAVLIVVATVAVTVGIAVAQQASKQQSTPRDPTIAVNSPVAHVKELLARANIEPTGPKSFAAHPEGDQWLFYSLEKGKSDLVLRYSPRSNRLTGLTVYFLGYPRSKTNEISIQIVSLTLHFDSSYSLRFPAPRGKADSSRTQGVSK